MKKWLAALFLVVAVNTALAQQAFVGPGFSSPPIGVSSYNVRSGYLGPGDVISGATAWYSVSRGYNAADGLAAFNACLPAGTSCTDVSLTYGAVKSLPQPLNTCNNTTVECVVATLYDKTGHGNNLTQATNGSRAILVVPGPGNGCTLSTQFCLKFTTTQTYTLAGFNGAVDIPQPYSISTFTAPAAVAASRNLFDSTNSAGNDAAGLVATSASANAVALYCGTPYSTSLSFYSTAWHSIQGVCNNIANSNILQVDAINETGQTGGANPFFNAHVNIGDDQFSQAFTGFGSEWGIWPSGLSTTQLAALNTNQQAFYNPNAFTDDAGALAFLPNNLTHFHIASTNTDWYFWYGWQSVGGTFQAVARVKTYNETTGVIVGPITIGTAGGSVATSGDYHGTPNCTRDGGGYWYCGYGAHSTALNLIATTAPDDPTTFTSIGTFGTNVTGALPFYISGVNKIFLFYGTQGNATNNQSAEFMASCTPSAGACTFGTPKNIFDVATSGNTGWQAGGDITTDGTNIYFVTNYATTLNGAWTAAYSYKFYPATGNVGNFAGTDVVAPASQPLGPVSYLNSTAGYSVGTSTDFGQSGISINGGTATILLTDYTTGAVLKVSQNSGANWPAPSTITSNLIAAAGFGIACSRVNGSGNLEAYFSDNANGVSRSVLQGGVWSSPQPILGQQASTPIVTTMNCLINGNDNISLAIGETSSDGVTILGGLRGYLWGVAGFIANPAGL